VKYAIAHVIRLAAATPVWEHHCELRLAPGPTDHQRVGSVTVDVEPTAEVRTYRDGFANTVHAFDLAAPHGEVRVMLRAAVETMLDNPFAFAPVAPSAERGWMAEAVHLQPRLWDYLIHSSPATPPLASLEVAVPGRDAAKPLLEALQLVVQWTAEHFTVAEPEERAPAALAEALRTDLVDARTLAHLLVSVARAWGAPARYVHGHRDPGYNDGEAPTLHAWAEVLVPGAGWRGLDPCAGLVTNDTYVTVASGRDASDCPPVRSTCKGDDAASAEHGSLIEVRCDQ
jgi:transglutaminase-like putative cysteine protease